MPRTAPATDPNLSALDLVVGPPASAAPPIVELTDAVQSMGPPSDALGVIGPPPPGAGDIIEGLSWPVAMMGEVSWFEVLSSHPLVKGLLPIPILVLLMWPIWWFFKKTWRHLDSEARQLREAQGAEGSYDPRPAVCLIIVAIVLSLQEYYGGRSFYNELIRPALANWERSAPWIDLGRFDEYYAHLYWALARVGGYVVIPFALWKLIFPRDSLLDMGLRTRGFFRHAWVYVAATAVVIPAVLLVAQQPDFANYYPFYRNSSRSWFDFGIWEFAYFAQFLALEMFFRGFILGALRRTMGSAAIFVMAVPYCMIHYGKPYLEAQGAIIAGIVLGSLAMRTRSIYAGFMVHVTIAGLMDWVALFKRDALPETFWPPPG